MSPYINEATKNKLREAYSQPKERCPVCKYEVFDTPCEYCFLKSQVAALEAENKMLREALDMMFSSAHPNERDHPAMFCAWKEARAVLAATEQKP